MDDRITIAATLVLFLCVPLTSKGKTIAGETTPAIEQSVGGPDRVVTGADGTFAVRIPQNWSYSPNGTFDSFVAFGPEGDAFGAGVTTVWLNPASVQFFVQHGATQQQAIAMSRLVFPPSSPADIVSQLYPRISGGAVQSVRILQYETLASFGGATAAFIRYEYILLPHGDPLFAGQVNPVLLRQNQVQMQGAGLIITFPPLFNPLQTQAFPDLSVANQWWFVSRTIEAPASVFNKNRGIYSRIWESYTVSIQALQQSGREQLQAFEQMNRITESNGYVWRCVLDGPTYWWQRQNQAAFCSDKKPLFPGQILGELRNVPGPRGNPEQ